MLIVGLMTGTSLDGIDAALVEIDGEDATSLEWRLRHFVTAEYTADRREQIHRVMVDGSSSAVSELHAAMGEWLSEAVKQVCRAAGIELDEVDLIGSHGQTIWHDPPTATRRGSTLQIGCPATIAERTGIPVVSDFRSRDMAAGGQGAPLVPWVDRVLFSAEDRARALQNIGGIGNVTRLPPRGSSDPLLAFDTGPGNALIDGAVQLATGGRLAFDKDGLLAARGEIDHHLLDELIQHPFFQAPPPKSTGREAFGRPFLERLVQAVRPEGDQDWMDLIATLTELTATSIAIAYERWLPPVTEVFVSGGGALNRTLMSRIGALLHPIPVRDSGALGLGAMEKEAVAFAVLAWAHVRSLPANEPTATGASGSRILGSLTPAG